MRTRAPIEFKTTSQAVRDLDVWGQPGFGIDQAPFHKRTYGLKSADSLGKPLLLDVNRASEAIGWSIAPIRPIAQGLTALFDPSCT